MSPADGRSRRLRELPRYRIYDSALTREAGLPAVAENVETGEQFSITRDDEWIKVSDVEALAKL